MPVALADFNKAVGMADSRVTLTDDRHHAMTFSSSSNVRVAEEVNMEASISVEQVINSVDSNDGTRILRKCAVDNFVENQKKILKSTMVIIFH